MTRILAYCGFIEATNIVGPRSGVSNSPVQMLASDRLRLLWSEVEWPFDPKQLQKHALEFHGVVHEVFRQTAVVPFRLLSIFDDLNSLHAFAGEHSAAFVADLERLRDYVQMEAVVYVIGERAPADASSGRAYLERKAGAQRLAGEHATALEAALQPLSHEMRVRQVKNGYRIFALMRRGEEERFRRTTESVRLPDAVSRRVSGPWPASEFLSETVKAPQVGRK